MTLNVEPKRRGSKMEISPVVPTVTEKSYMTQTVTKAARMTEAQRKSAIRRKRKAGNPGGKPTMVSTFAKKRRKKRARKKG